MYGQERIRESDPRRMNGSFYRIAKSILRSDEDCADAAQEAVMKAFEKLHTLRDDRYAKTWLIRILIKRVFPYGR